MRVHPSYSLCGTNFPSVGTWWHASKTCEGLQAQAQQHEQASLRWPRDQISRHVARVSYSQDVYYLSRY